jgi:hypothetical protein
MRHRTLRSCLAILSSLLLAGPPVQARSVEINEVIQVLGNFRSSELKLGSVWPDQVSLNSVVKTAYGAQREPGAAVPEASITSSSLFAGVLIIPNEQQQSTVETIGRGTVQGTVCDCGEILVAGGGFPKWPLLFLAAIPFFFIDRGDSSPTPSPSPTPIPTITLTVPTPTPTPPPPVPEPGSLLLLGTGLAAFFFGLRRRFKAKDLISKTTEAADESRIQK